jgi:hypothetical protein
LELASKMHKIPPGVNLMGGPTTEAKPADAPGELLSLRLRRAAKLRTIPVLDGTRTLSLLTSDDQPYAGGYTFVDEKKNAMTPRKITLHDKDEKVVATCLQDKAVQVGRPQNYHIYGTYPMYEGQASKTVDGLDGPVYQWMELEGIQKHPYYEITSFKDKKHYEPLCIKGTCKKAMSGMEHGVILSSLDKGSALDEDDNMIASMLHLPLMYNKSEGDETGWNMRIAPGVDPLAIACLTAIFDHTEGQNI